MALPPLSHPGPLDAENLSKHMQVLKKVSELNHPSRNTIQNIYAEVFGLPKEDFGREVELRTQLMANKTFEYLKELPVDQEHEDIIKILSGAIRINDVFKYEDTFATQNYKSVENQKIIEEAAARLDKFRDRILTALSDAQPPKAGEESKYVKEVFKIYLNRVPSDQEIPHLINNLLKGLKLDLEETTTFIEDIIENRRNNPDDVNLKAELDRLIKVRQSFDVLIPGARNLVQFSKPKQSLFSFSSKKPEYAPETLLKEVDKIASIKLSELDHQITMRMHLLSETAASMMEEIAPEFKELTRERPFLHHPISEETLKSTQNNEVVKRNLVLLAQQKPELAEKINRFVIASKQAKLDPSLNNVRETVAAYKEVNNVLNSFIIAQPESKDQKELKAAATRMQGYLGSIVIDQQLPHLVGRHGVSPNTLVQLYDYLEKIPGKDEHGELAGAPKLVDIIDRLTTIRQENLSKLLKNDGDVAVATPELIKSHAELTNLRMAIKMAIPEKYHEVKTTNALGKEEVRIIPEEDAEVTKVLDFLTEISESALPGNSQLVIDNFAEILPKNLRHNYYQGDRHLPVKEPAEQTYRDELSKLNTSQLSPAEKEARKRELDRTRGFRNLGPFEGREFWASQYEGKPKTGPLPFVKDTRVVGYMSFDKKNITEARVELDFSTLNLQTPKQSAQALEFVELLCSIGLGSDAPFKKWFAMRNNPNLTLAMIVEEVLPKIDSEGAKTRSEILQLYDRLQGFSDEQKKQLLRIGLDFAYKMIHDMRLARMQVGQ